ELLIIEGQGEACLLSHSVTDRYSRIAPAIRKMHDCVTS
ncbi:unnamed protein product, partial [Allacma fusca]